MRFHQTSPGNRAFTLVEVSAIIVCTAVVAVMLASIVGLNGPCCGSKVKYQRAQCVNNLRNLGLAGRIFAADNGDLYPWQVSVEDGGSREYHTATGAVYPGVIGRTVVASDNNGSVWAHLLALSNELNTPKIISCPADQERRVAPNFGAILRTNAFQENKAVSYFLGLGAKSNLPDTMLGGDRRIAVGNVALTAGYRAIPTNRPVSFSPANHEQEGNLLLMDGSVQQVRGKQFSKAVAKSAAALKKSEEKLLIP